MLARQMLLVVLTNLYKKETRKKQEAKQNKEENMLILNKVLVIGIAGNGKPTLVATTGM